MKLKKFSIIILAVLCVAMVTIAATPGAWNNGRQKITALWQMWNGTEVRYFDGSTQTMLSGSTITGAGTFGTSEAEVIPLASAVIGNIPSKGGTLLNPRPIGMDATTSPGLSMVSSDNEVHFSIYWAATESSPVMFDYNVPYNYSSGLSFRAYVDTSASGASPAAVQFDYTANGTTYTGTTAYTQGSDAEVDLVLPSSGSSISAGDWGVLRIWPSESAVKILKGLNARYLRRM